MCEWCPTMGSQGSTQAHTDRYTESIRYVPYLQCLRRRGRDGRGEDQTQPVVGNGLVVISFLTRIFKINAADKLRHGSIEAGTAARVVNRHESASGNEQ